MMILRAATRSEEPTAARPGSVPVCRFVFRLPNGSQIDDLHPLQEPNVHALEEYNYVKVFHYAPPFSGGSSHWTSRQTAVPSRIDGV